MRIGKEEKKIEELLKRRDHFIYLRTAMAPRCLRSSTNAVLDPLLPMADR